MRALVPGVLLLAACAVEHGKPAPAFIAQESDFAAFQTWPSFELPSSGSPADLVYPAGARVAFLNQRPPRGATRYPPGTIIVKVVKRDPTPQDWEIFAVAKRGGGYNAAGAVDWEFFLLDVDASGTPRIASRGLAPGDDGHGDMSFPSMGGGYVSGGTIAPCNLCHGQAKPEQDHIMSPLLFPSSTALP